MSITLGGSASQPRVGGRQGTVDAEMASSGDQVTAGASNAAPRSSVNSNTPAGQVVEALEVNGEIPQARFGHTITIVSKAKVVLFGGATGDTGKYSMTGETFMYNILNKAWQKLTGKSSCFKSTHPARD